MKYHGFPTLFVQSTSVLTTSVIGDDVTRTAGPVDLARFYSDVQHGGGTADHGRTWLSYLPASGESGFMLNNVVNDRTDGFSFRVSTDIATGVAGNDLGAVAISVTGQTPLVATARSEALAISMTGNAGDAATSEIYAIRASILGSVIAQPTYGLYQTVIAVANATNTFGLYQLLSAWARGIYIAASAHADTNGLIQMALTTPAATNSVKAINLSMTSGAMTDAQWLYGFYGTYNTSACAAATSNAAVIYLAAPTADPQCNDYGIYIEAGYDFGIANLSPMKIAQLTIAPTSDGAEPWPLDFQLEGWPTAGVYTQGRVINMEYGAARTLDGALNALFANFTTNLIHGGQIVTIINASISTTNETNNSYVVYATQHATNTALAPISNASRGISITADDTANLVGGATVARSTYFIELARTATATNAADTVNFTGGFLSMTSARAGAGSTNISGDMVSMTLAGTVLAATLTGYHLSSTVTLNNAAAILKGFCFDGSGVTHTSGIVYGVDINLSTAATAGTQRGINITMPVGYVGGVAEAAIYATGNGNIFSALSGDGIAITMTEAASTALNITNNATGNCTPINVSLTQMQIGTIMNVGFGAAEVLTGTLSGIRMDFSTSLTQNAQSIIGMFMMANTTNETNASTFLSALQYVTQNNAAAISNNSYAISISANDTANNGAATVTRGTPFILLTRTSNATVFGDIVDFTGGFISMLSAVAGGAGSETIAGNMISMTLAGTVPGATLRGYYLDSNVTLNNAAAVHYGMHLDLSSVTLTSYSTNYGLRIDMPAPGAGIDGAIGVVLAAATDAIRMSGAEARITSFEQTLTIRTTRTAAGVGSDLSITAAGGVGGANGGGSITITSGSSVGAGVVGSISLVPGAPGGANKGAIDIGNTVNTGDITIGNPGSARAFNIYGNAASEISVTSGPLNIYTATSGAINISALSASTWQVTGANLTIQTVTTGAVNITANGVASTFNVNDNTLTLRTTQVAAGTGKNVSITASAAVGGGPSVGGEIILTSGAGIGGGAAGDIRLTPAGRIDLNGDMEFTPATVNVYNNAGAAQTINYQSTTQDWDWYWYGRTGLSANLWSYQDGGIALALNENRLNPGLNNDVGVSLSLGFGPTINDGIAYNLFSGLLYIYYSPVIGGGSSLNEAANTDNLVCIYNVYATSVLSLLKLQNDSVNNVCLELAGTGNRIINSTAGSLTIRTSRAVAGGSDNISITAADAVGAGPSVGGSFTLNLGARAGAGTDGIATINMKAGSYLYLDATTITHTSTSGAFYVSYKSGTDITMMSRFDIENILSNNAGTQSIYGNYTAITWNTVGAAGTHVLYANYYALVQTAVPGVENLYYNRYATLAGLDLCVASLFDCTLGAISELAHTGTSTNNGRVVDRAANFQEVFMDCLEGAIITNGENTVPGTPTGTTLGATKTGVALGNIVEGALIAQMDVPRSVVIVVSTDGGGAIAGNVVITGTTSDGTTGVTDTIDIGQAAGSAYIRKFGLKAFIRVTNISYPATNQGGNVQQLWFLFGNMLGLANQIGDEAADADIYHVKKNNANLPSGSYARSRRYGTVDMAQAGVVQIAVGEDYTIWYAGHSGTRD